MIPKKCEWHEHKGDPTKNHGEGVWWLKDPELKWLCPNCNHALWEKRFKQYVKEAIRMGENIKGIIHLDGDREDFIKKATTGKEESLGVKLSMDWELDRITLFLQDKDENPIASLVFDNSDFQSIADKVMPPSNDEMEEPKNPTEEEKKSMEEDAKEAMDNPVKKEIEEYHKK